MEKQVLDYVIKKTHELMNAFSCSKEARTAAEKWLESIDTDAETDETKKYIAELEADIMPIDQLIGFAGSEQGKAYFGADQAAGIVAHAQEIKTAGARYCDCPACQAVEAILAKKEEMLK